MIELGQKLKNNFFLNLLCVLPAIVVVTIFLNRIEIQIGNNLDFLDEIIFSAFDILRIELDHSKLNVFVILYCALIFCFLLILPILELISQKGLGQGSQMTKILTSDYVEAICSSIIVMLLIGHIWRVGFKYFPIELFALTLLSIGAIKIRIHRERELAKRAAPQKSKQRISFSSAIEFLTFLIGVIFFLVVLLSYHAENSEFHPYVPILSLSILGVGYSHNLVFTRILALSLSFLFLTIVVGMGWSLMK